MKLNKNLSYSILSCIIIFSILDILLNFLNIRPSNSNYGWYNAHNTYKHIIPDISKNKYGTRDTLKKKNNKPKIILLGDSGIELAQKSYKMPARIIEQYNNNEVEVYSFGSWGWGTDQQLLILENTIKEINPTDVILFFTPNDLTDNFHHIGYNGEKPTFQLKNEGQLIYPKFKGVKKILNKSWFYRTGYRIYLKFASQKFLMFNDKKYLLKLKNCENQNYISIKDLIDKKNDFEFNYTKRIRYLNSIKKESITKTDFATTFYQFITTRNNYEQPTDREFDYFRSYKTELEVKKIKLTNLLLNKIQNVSENNNADFTLVNVINYNHLFMTDKKHSICINEKLIEYQNKNYFNFFDETFNGIKNIFTYKVKRGDDFYDYADGHLNYKTNKKLFFQVAEFANSLKK